MDIKLRVKDLNKVKLKKNESTEPENWGSFDLVKLAKYVEVEILKAKLEYCDNIKEHDELQQQLTALEEHGK